MTFLKWDITKIGPLQIVTGDGAATEVLTPKQHALKALGFDKAAKAKDVRPTLVYFHWPHEHAKHGKLSTELCGKVLNEEQVARWGTLFRCIQVDMGESKPELAKLVGAKSAPSLALLDLEGKVVLDITPPKSSSKLRKILEGGVAKFPAFRKVLKREIAQQAKLLKQAKKLDKADKLTEALEIVDKVRFHDVRVGPDFDKAQAYGLVLEQKIANDNK